MELLYTLSIGFIMGILIIIKTIKYSKLLCLTGIMLLVSMVLFPFNVEYAVVSLLITLLVSIFAIDNVYKSK
ncbi:hypothetical protein DRN75_04160 [Nanoarchaeota archaeon]|nr:MAG: hypothetical protein DRN75_04160 [Nanoarchaeota archaeon]